MKRIRIVVKTSDGAEFQSYSWDDMVSQLKLDMWCPPRTRQEYMTGVAKRQEMFDGQEITYSDSKSFLEELLRVGTFKSISLYNE